MPRTKKTHMNIEMREVIEEGLRSGQSARTIAKRISVSPSTVTREVKANRTVKRGRPQRNDPASALCANYESCQRSAEACPNCQTRFTNCKKCRTKMCYTVCDGFKLKMCDVTEKWPYVCPSACRKRGWCKLPKCSYDARAAQEAYEGRLSSSRTGICLTQSELNAMNGIVVPLSKQGQSFEAIWAGHADELPVCVRSAYNYQQRGILGIAALDMPRKARLLPRKRPDKKVCARQRVERAGRTYDDFLKLPLEERVRVVQGDSVMGYSWNTTDILSLHVLAYGFQLYLKKTHGDTASVIAWLDVIERALGSPEAFAAIFGVLLVDRGVEFDDWESMERSCLEKGVRRCHVFYCDAMDSNQKSQAERNHEQLRRILPKGRSDFDKLDVWDVAVCASHVNSYPLARWSGKCPMEVAAGLVPQCLLDELGIERIPADEVVLKPYLMAHAVAQ